MIITALRCIRLTIFFFIKKTTNFYAEKCISIIYRYIQPVQVHCIKEAVVSCAISFTLQRTPVSARAAATNQSNIYIIAKKCEKVYRSISIVNISFNYRKKPFSLFILQCVLL